MANPRTLLAVWAAQAAALTSRATRLGGGTAVGGLVGLRLQPALVSQLASGLGEGCVLITGTNGKTTTARMIAETARTAGLRPLANASGSNLMRGLASTLALAAGPSGRIDGEDRLGVFEVDEATLPLALRDLRPRAIVFTNLFRDQLDRYGEVDTVAGLWSEALRASGYEGCLVLNADDPSVAALGEGRSEVVYFGINDQGLDRGCQEHAADALVCSCGRPYEYGVSYYGHLGHWRCPGCGRARPATQVTAKNVDLDEGRTLRFSLGPPERGVEVRLALGGLYNVYNALAATAASVALGLSEEAVIETLNGFSAAFGRQETFEVEGRRVEVLLGKNPAGLNQVIATLSLARPAPTVMFVLNDRIADGRDVSWIWDADFELTAGRFEKAIVSGTRAEDMALRLKYAGWEAEQIAVEPDIRRALDLALADTPAGERLPIVPTYTAMLEVREILARRMRRKPFWRE